ncbi:MAG: CHAT domain-containing protein [Geitlerinemataceae cyanobacterium]
MGGCGVAGSGGGLLTAGEILDLKLNADLVVLSACDTGRGEITGDGVVGLSRALVTAGVPSIVVSLWKVDDAATAELMQQHPEPSYWAAFTLIGEAN